MKHRFFAFLLTLLLAFGLVTGASAQTYSFELVEEVVHVYLNKDGIMALDYEFAFKNNPGAKPIDFVDVGLPNGNYDRGSISASVNGQAVSVGSDYQGDGPYGVAVELGSRAIPAGSSGRVRVYVGRIERMFFQDTEEETYASSEFSPTWFGSQYVTGQSRISVIFHLPPGVTNDEPRYHPARGGWPCDTAPLAARDQDQRVTYEWTCASASGARQYTFGASFPKKYIPENAITSPSALDSFSFDSDALFGFGFMCCFGVLFFGAPLLGAISDRRRRMQYIKPQISIEGHGIKRGLTAVEAGILLGLPLDKVMTMLLFGIIKKGAAEVTSRDPLNIKRLDATPTQSLRAYEVEFLTAFEKGNTPARRKALQNVTVNLVKSVTEKMKGFSGKETKEYYQAINEKAWQQIAAAGTPEVQSKMFEEALEWTMLDKDYDDRSRRTFTRPIFVPTWWHRYDPIYRPSAPVATGGSIPLGEGGRATLPGADFAASIVTGTQDFAQKVLGGTESFTQGVTSVTNPPPAPSRSSHRSGGSCACACACAGCACACAGGGR